VRYEPVEKLKEVVAENLESAQPAIEAAVNKFTGGLNEVAKFSNAVDNVTKKVKNEFTEAVDTVIRGFKKVDNALGGMLTGPYNVISDVVDYVNHDSEQDRIVDPLEGQRVPYTKK
jgi:hypothetical protein